MTDPLHKASEGTVMSSRQGPAGTDDVWSNVTQNGARLKWRELYELERKSRLEADRWRTIVADLHRNPHGRHEGDSDSGDPSGRSQGNPNFRAGDTFGWDIGGRAYIYPPAAERYRFEAWLELRL